MRWRREIADPAFGTKLQIRPAARMRAAVRHAARLLAALGVAARVPDEPGPGNPPGTAQPGGGWISGPSTPASE